MYLPGSETGAIADIPLHLLSAGVQDARQEMTRAEPVEAQYGPRERCSSKQAAMTAAIDDCLDSGICNAALVHSHSLSEIK